jgi:lactate dehydrogenase-like 2-hydroxyacid dehydrogenase
MKKKLIIVTDRIQSPDLEQEILGSNFEIAFLPELVGEEKNRLLNNAYGLLVWHEKIDSNFVRHLTNCKILVRYGAGIDNLDLLSLKNKKIVVGNCPDYGVEEVADATATMILFGVRNLAEFSKVNLFDPRVWGSPSSRSVKRSRLHSLGIIGLGRIGTAVALRLKSFGISVGFFDPYIPRGMEKSLSLIRYDSLENLLANSSIVSLHCPLTDETKAMVNKYFISRMQPASILVNTSRGGLISSLADIDEGLESGQLGFVALDVLDEEPPSSNNVFIDRWRKSTNPVSNRVLITPHIAYYSENSLMEIRTKAAQSILDFSMGHDPRYRII